MVEGNLDVRYFELAAKHYLSKKNVYLIGKDLSIFAAGTGDRGGTYGVCEQFPTLWNQARVDLDPNGKIRFRVVALLDNDPKGKTAVSLMCKANRALVENSNVFLLNRNMPRMSRDPKPLTEHILDANRLFARTSCTIEDLLDRTLCELYAEQNPHHVQNPRGDLNADHYVWTDDGKFGLAKFVASHAELEQLRKVVEVIKSMRFYLGLPADGVP